MCNKKRLIEKVLNRPMGDVRYKLVRRCFQMTEKECEMLMKLIENKESSDESE